MMVLNLSPALALPSSAAAPATINPNLLKWTEAFDNAVWGKTSASVLADSAVGPDGATHADQITNAAINSVVAQTSETTATSGSAVNKGAGLIDSWDRYSVSGTFDTGTFTFSVWLLGTSGDSLIMRIEASGGFIRCSLRDLGDQITYLAWGAKLETGSSPTGSTSDYGSRTT